MNWAEVRWFTPGEFICRGIECCGGSVHMDSDFVFRLDDLRERFGKPLVVTSGYRCPSHNAAVSTTGRSGPHTWGQAVDIAIHGRDAYALIRLAIAKGFTGIGVKQHGPHGRRFLHLDTLADLNGPRPWIWSYP